MRKLEIQNMGTTKFPRFIIANGNGEVFAGSGWRNDRDQAVLFTEGQEVAAQFNALQDQMYQDFPLREFTATLNIRVRSATPFTQQELEQYLEEATRIFLNHEKGTGPVEESMVQLGVTWRDMHEEVAVRENER